MPTNHDAAWLDQLHETFVEALRSNDLKAIGDCYTQDAVLLPPGRTLIAGREAIVAYWQAAERIQDLIFEATDTKSIGDAALREAGNLLITMRGEGRETFNNAAKYACVWLQVDGAWKIDSTTWNGAGGAGGRRRGRRGGGGGGGGRRGEARQGGARQGEARQGEARQGGGGARPGGGGGGRQGGGGQGGGGRQGAGRGRQGRGDA